MTRQLAQLNIATLRHPLDDPRIADFNNALPMVNGAGEQSAGFVWRLQSDSGDATDIRIFDDPLVIVNLTVWQSLDALKAFAYRGIHRDFFRRRSEWFVEGSTRTALWWLPAGELPTTDDAKRRLDFIDAFGASPYAFEMGQNRPALVIERASVNDARAQQLIRGLDGDVDLDEDTWAEGCFVVAEIDDLPVACGGYRTADDTTAEIKRMYVARSARGMKVGAAIISELEAIARGNGAQRMLLETWYRQLPALEKFGFRRCPCGDESEQLSASAMSVCVEKALTA